MKHYSIVRKIGDGGFGNVYLVKNDHNTEHHAMKRVSLNQLPKYVTNELEILKSLSHPRIIKFIEFFPSLSYYNFIMEYAEKGSLRSMILRFQKNNWKMSNDNLISLLMDIFYGVRYLHLKNIIHRDIKPENILLTSDDRAKLADFGLSKVVDHCCPLDNSFIGTLNYMSPEVYLHKSYDNSCDIWALGVILYELAMMRYPFDKSDKLRLSNLSLPFKCPTIDWKSRKCNPNLQNVLECMLQRDPKKRRNITIICRHPSFKSNFSDLEKEYYVYLSTNGLLNGKLE